MLAIDLGTTGVKVAVVDSELRIRAAASEPLITRFAPDGRAEQDAEAWWQAIGRASRAAVGSSSGSGGVGAIAVTSQYMSVVAIDANGVPLAPVVMWMDNRGGPIHPLRDDADAFMLWLDRHGLPPLPSDDLAHIAVLAREHPEIEREVAAFVEPVDAVIARLTGRIVATPTTAFPLMCTDNRVWDAVAYDSDLVARAGVDPDRLPPIGPPDEPVGPVTAVAARHLGVDRTTVVLPGTVDSITSAIGGGALDASRASRS